MDSDSKLTIMEQVTLDFLNQIKNMEKDLSKGLTGSRSKDSGQTEILSLELARLSMEHTQDNFLTTNRMVKENTKLFTKVCFIKEAGKMGKNTVKVMKNVEMKFTREIFMKDRKQELADIKRSLELTRVKLKMMK
jgi:hypothetical protein